MITDFSAVSNAQHTGSAAKQHGVVDCLPIFSSSLPFCTLTNSYTVPIYGCSPSTLNMQTQPQSVQSQLLPPAPLSSPAAYHTCTSSAFASILSSPMLTPATTGASTPLLSTSSSSSSPSSCSIHSAACHPPSSAFFSPSPPLTRSRLSASKRKACRAAQHRDIGSTRRIRESIALAQLQHLVCSSFAYRNNNNSNSALVDGSSFSVSPPMGGNGGPALFKTAVLEQTVAEVMRLHKVIAVQRALLTELTAPLHRPVHQPVPPTHPSEWSRVHDNEATCYHH